MPAPAAVRTLPELRASVAAWRREGLRVGLVPTMGALHDGHLALMRHALARADRVVASIFVNPTQFGPGEDLDRYPRDEPGDLARLAEVGVRLAWLPPVEAMYPPGDRTRVTVEELGEGLEAVARPHFFRGVATVVTKLLNQVRPDLAVFGEKDYQQLLVVRAARPRPRDPDEIVAHPTVREPDGSARPRATAISLRRSGTSRRCSIRCSRRPRGRSPTAAPRPRPSRRARAGCSRRASRASTISSFGTPRTWRPWTMWASGPPACSPPPYSAGPG